MVDDAIGAEQSVLDIVVKWLENEMKYVLLWYKAILNAMAALFSSQEGLN